MKVEYELKVRYKTKRHSIICLLKLMENYLIQNRVLRRIFGPKKDEVTGGWRKLYNEDLRDLYSLPGIIKMIQSRMRWMVHVS
jgi:hypothetical protein